MERDRDSIIPLSRWRAALARARRTRRADAILAEPDAARLVPDMPVQELYYAIREVGLADAEELVALASPEQVRGFLDLDAWQRDHLDETRMTEWIDALVSAGPDKLGAAIEGMDPELIALYLQRQLRVYDLTFEEPPEEPEGHFSATPDRFFLLDILVEGEQGKSLERMIDWLYRADLLLARQVLMSAKYELPSDLEDWAYRWRSGRMADLGFVDFYDALAVFKYLDPASVRVEEGTAARSVPEEAPTALPAMMAGKLEGAPFLNRALGGLAEEAQIERLFGALVTLVNKVMSAERVEPGDSAAAEAALTRSAAYLGLGLEYLARGDAARAADVLGSVALERIFRVGFSLTLQLKRLADLLVEKGRVATPAGRLLLDEPADAVVEALRRPLPELCRALETPAAGGARPFASLADVQSAASALEEMTRLPQLVFDGLGVRHDALDEVAEPGAPMTFGTLVRTLGANILLDCPPSLVPLAPTDRKALRAALADPAAAGAKIAAALGARLTERAVAASPVAAAAACQGWLGDLGAVIERPGGILFRFG